MYLRWVNISLSKPLRPVTETCDGQFLGDWDVVRLKQEGASQSSRDVLEPVVCEERLCVSGHKAIIVKAVHSIDSFHRLSPFHLQMGLERTPTIT